MRFFNDSNRVKPHSKKELFFLVKNFKFMLSEQHFLRLMLTMILQFTALA